MDDEHAVVGSIPRGFAYVNQEVPLPGPAPGLHVLDQDVPRTTGTETRTGTGTGDTRTTTDYGIYHGHKYSNKNWNQQQQRSGTGAQPSSRTLSQALIHPQSDLVEAPRLLQLGPSQSSQSHWQQNQGQQGQQSHQDHQDHQDHQGHHQGQQGHQQSQLAVSSSHPHPHSHVHSTQAHQPYHYRHTSEPPRLPPLAASLSSFSSLSSLSSIPTSPFDPFHTRDGDNYFLSFAASPTPATSHAIGPVPRLPPQTDDIVSPISETRSSTPAFRSFDHGSEPTAHSPAAQSPTFTSSLTALKRRPNSYSSTRASLLDDKDFELSLGVTERAEHPATSRFTSAAVTSAVAQDVAHLTDERSDDWFRFTARESTISKHPNSFAEAHQSMTVAMTADELSVPGHQQQSGQFAAISSSSSSFTPLPPIRRTSTFDVLRKKGLVDYDSDTAPSPIEKDHPPIPMPPGPASPAQQTSNGQLSSAQSASRASPHTSVQPQPPQNPDLNLPGQSQPAMPQHPEGLVAVGPGGQPGIPQHALMQMHPHQMVMGRGGPAGQQVAPGHMMINGQVQAILSLPGGRRWTEQESHLAEPLNPSNRNRPANSGRVYTAYDKETEGEGAPPHFGGGSSQPVQTRPRNVSNTTPPTAATRFPSLFPHPGAEPPRNQGQLPLSQHALTRRHNGNPGHRDSFDDRSLAKEMDVRVDQISVSSAAAEDNDKHRRGSASLFSLGHRRNSSSTTAVQQVPPDGAAEKKKNFFASVTGMGHSQPKPKSNLGPTKTQPFDQSDQVSFQNQGDHGPGKKRLSELKGMIMGVGNAKEGVKDDQLVKVETIYESRESMQSPPRNFTVPQGAQGGLVPQPASFGSQVQAHVPGPQASMQSHPSQMQPPGATSPPPLVGVGRASTSGPQSSQNQQVKADESGKKSSGGGFLGGLFSKQGNKTKDTKAQSPQQMPPSTQRPTHPPVQAGYLPFRPGQMQLPGQQLGPHPMLAGQPPIQRGPPGQSPSPPFFHDPTLPSPSVQTAQAITMRRPSEITVSSQTGTHQPPNQRPGMGSPQGSQGTPKQQASSIPPLGQRPSQIGLQGDGGMGASQSSPELSDDSPLEKPALGNPSAIPRYSPNRKPVGSGNPRGDGSFMASAIPPVMMRQAGSPSPGPGQQRVPSQPPYVQQSPQLGSSGGLNDMRQTTLPSPEPSPDPSQSNHSSSSKLQGDQFSRGSPDPRDSRQDLGILSNEHGPPGSTSIPGPDPPNGLAWGPNGIRPSVPPLASPSAAVRVQPPRTPSSPVPSMDQSKLSKFFGAYDGGKPATQPQANKEKSAASKFLGAFKRSSKQNEGAEPQQRPSASPQIPQQGIRPGAPGPVAPGGIPNLGGVPAPVSALARQAQMPMQPGQGRDLVSTQIPAQQVHGGRGQPGQIPPQGVPIPAQAGRGQIPPTMMMQAGRGQMPPPMFAGAGPLPPHVQRPVAPGKQGNEPQYDQVPIPRGYEAVHGYGPGGMLAFSPYNAGRPGHPPIQYSQYPPTLLAGFPQRQWDPRMMPPSQADSPPSAAPGASQFVPQGVPTNISYRGPPQHSQLPGPTQNPSPPSQALHSALSQGQQPSQFPQSPSLHQPGELSPSGQAQILAQMSQNAPPQQSQPYGQEIQREPSPNAKVQPYSWTGTPQNTQSPAPPIQQPNPPTPNLVPQTGVRAVSSSASPASNGTSTPQSQHTTATGPGQPSQFMQANSTRQASPVNQLVDQSAQIATTLSQGQLEATRAAARSPSSITTAASGLLRSQDAARLTSRMSISKHVTKSDASFGSDKPADRTLTVSPEPPGPRHGPIHQVSEQNLGTNVERTNGHSRYGSEDIYDATPRLDSSTPRQVQGEDQAHENTKYAGSDKGRILTNGAGAGIGLGLAGGVAGVSATPVVTEDNMSFLDGPDDSEPDENSAGSKEEAPKEEAISPPQRTATVHMNIEPEEKILVDLPVELAAVNDDDDGIPMMSATSYPGQEWNPYGAGEFGDWE
ncbi:hypothetical protein F5Y12DRAFT_597177 [Xylaria sp. FL1777]|nr:hypothetical protein F5Y12DRAFT_597177 [Xylaria sp. FL1777]